MNPIVILLCAVIGPVVMFLMFKYADKIRNSKFWPLACLAWIYVSGNTIGAWFVLMDKTGIKLPPEEVSVPVVFGVIMLMVLVAGYFNIYRPYRKLSKPPKEQVIDMLRRPEPKVFKKLK